MDSERAPGKERKKTLSGGEWRGPEAKRREGIPSDGAGQRARRGLEAKNSNEGLKIASVRRKVTRNHWSHSARRKWKRRTKEELLPHPFVDTELNADLISVCASSATIVRPKRLRHKEVITINRMSAAAKSNWAAETDSWPHLSLRFYLSRSIRSNSVSLSFPSCFRSCAVYF